MRITYDSSVDAAYIYLKDSIGPGEAKRTYSCDPDKINGGIINLDFDVEGRLLGIEVLDASGFLPKEAIRTADRIS